MRNRRETGVRRPILRSAHCAAATVVYVLLLTACAPPRLRASLPEAEHAGFGPCTRKELDFTPGAVTVHRRGQSRMVDVALLGVNGNTLHVFSLTDSASLVAAGIAPLGARYDRIRSADVDADGATEHVLVSEEPGAVAVVRRQAGRLEVSRYEIKEERPEHCEIADINTDGRPDILAFGKAMVGVRTFLNAGRGDFKQGPTLFPDVSAADLRAADLDRDGATDVILADWISNRVLSYKGISKSQFSEPLALDFPDEPGAIALLESPGGGLHRLAVTLPSRAEVRLFSRQGAGEFSPVCVVPYASPPSSVQLADVDQDGSVDIISATSLGIQVSFLSRDGRVSSTGSYGVVTSGGLWRVADMDGDGLPDLIAADSRQRSLVVVANAAWRGRVRWPDVYLVGPQPGFVSIGEIDGRSGPDLAVTSEGSSAVSILMNRGGGRFNGPFSVTVPDQPAQVALQEGSSTMPATLITTHRASGTVALTPVGTATRQGGRTELPGCTSPTILCADRTQGTVRQTILLSCREQRATSLTLVRFREMDGGQFLEQDISAPGGQSVVAAAPIPLLKDCGVSLIILARETPSAPHQSVYQITIDGSGRTRQQPLVTSLPDGASGLASGDLNGDAVPDVVISHGSGRGIGVSFGKKTASLSDSVVWAPESNGMTMLAVADLNGDRIDDVLLRSREGTVIKVIYGRRDKSLTAPRNVATVPSSAFVAVGRLGKGVAGDLVAADGRLNTVQILFDVFGR